MLPIFFIVAAVIMCDCCIDLMYSGAVTVPEDRLETDIAPVGRVVASFIFIQKTTWFCD